MILQPVTRQVGAALPDATIAVVVPACDEEERIETCLRSLVGQRDAPPTLISLCINNTFDATARRAEDAARRLGLPLLLTEVTFAAGGVGKARQIGHEAALRACPGASILLSTDADCIAASDWAAGMARALATAPVVLGGIGPISQELEALPAAYRAWSWAEDSYAALSAEFACLLDPEGPDGIGINTAGGASLGFRKEAYLALGGFRPMESGEDRDIVDRALAAGMRPVRAPEAVVAVSMRSIGRAPGGMAVRVADRLAHRNAPLDATLAPLQAMIGRYVNHRSRRGTVPDVAMSRAQAFNDLPDLERLVVAMRALPDVASRRRLLVPDIDYDHGEMAAVSSEVGSLDLEAASVPGE